MFNICIAQINMYIWSNTLYNTFLKSNQLKSNQMLAGFRGEGKTGIPGEKPLIAE